MMRTPLPSTRDAALLATLLMALGLTPFAYGEEKAPPDWKASATTQRFPGGAFVVPNWRFASGPHVRNAFRDVVAEARPATVRVQSDDRDVALGGIVGAEGWILTKASGVQGQLVCVLADGREFEARLVDANRDYNLALLKIDAEQLPTLTITDATAPQVGSWIATVGLEPEPLGVGVVSARPRQIPHHAGILGVQLDEVVDRPVIVRVFPDTPAARAGLLVNDRIVSIEGQTTPDREALIRAVRRFNPGDRVEVEVKRGEETLRLLAILSGNVPGRQPNRNDFQNQLGGRLSERRFGFPDAIQHDTVLRPEDCGGPIVNLDGEVVGFNVARSGRTESYAIASASLSKLIAELMPAATP
jgi:serine protease Do